MDKIELGIGVGVQFGDTTKWYKAHSMTRRKKDGAMVVFALDDNRTEVVIPAARFAGVSPGIRGSFSQEIHPDILDVKL